MNVEHPRLLILETSSRRGLVALAEGESLLGERRLDEARRHARDLVPAVRELLRANSWRPADVHAVAVSLGPGSYTGLRVGIMSAKTFCYATGAALIGIETFAALAAQAPAEVCRLDVVADGQQDRVYLQSFRRGDDGTMQVLAPLRICTVWEWAEGLAPDVRITGPGVDVHADRLSGFAQVLPPDLRLVQAESLLRIGLQRFRVGSHDDLWKVEPMYLRPSAAEEQWRGRK